MRVNSHTQCRVQQDMQKVENTGIPLGNLRDEVRHEDVSTVDEHLPDDLFRNIKEP